jgi:hypothetical protein
VKSDLDDYTLRQLNLFVKKTNEYLDELEAAMKRG